MSDCVSREAVINLMKTNWADNDGDTAMQISIDDVRELPSVELERAKGHWERNSECDVDVPEPFYYKCSNCGCPSRSNNHNFCPNCGADMREGDAE